MFRFIVILMGIIFFTILFIDFVDSALKEVRSWFGGFLGLFELVDLGLELGGVIAVTHLLMGAML